MSLAVDRRSSSASISSLESRPHRVSFSTPTYATDSPQSPPRNTSSSAFLRETSPTSTATIDGHPATTFTSDFPRARALAPLKSALRSPSMRSKSVCAPSSSSFAEISDTTATSSSSSSSSSVSPSFLSMTLQTPRFSLPATDSLHSRATQLALLAEQARLSSFGTSSLQIANANHQVLRNFAQHAREDLHDGASMMAQQGSTSNSRRSSLAATSAASPIRDRVWEETVGGPDFLSSASKLAHLFEIQEHNRREWAGHAAQFVAGRRWTMAPGSRKPSNLHKSGCDRSTPLGDGQQSDDNGRAEASEVRMGKRRRVSLTDAEAAQRSRRRVSFKAAAQEGEAALGNDGEVPPQGALVRGSALAQRSGSHGPQLLANVISSFSALLDSRQEACAGLARLAKSGDEMMHSCSAAAALDSARSRSRSRRGSPRDISGEENRSNSGSCSPCASSLGSTLSSDGSIHIRELSREDVNVIPHVAPEDAKATALQAIIADNGSSEASDPLVVKVEPEIKEEIAEIVINKARGEGDEKEGVEVVPLACGAEEVAVTAAAAAAAATADAEEQVEASAATVAA